MLCRPHDLAGTRLIPLAAFLLLALTALFLSTRPRAPPPFSPGRDGKFAPTPTPATTAPVTTAPPEPLLPLAPERTPVGGGRGVAFLYADEDGVVLSKKKATLESPDGRSSLMLQRDGNLVLRSLDADGAQNILWSTGTGDGQATARTVRIVPAPNGHPVLKVSATVDGAPSTLWHSDLLPPCASQPSRNGTTRRLELSSAGRLSLSGACDIYAPPSERRERSLAVLLSGTYTANQSCARPLFAGTPFTSIDVFAHVSFEGANDTKGAIEDELKECYGEDLRAAVVRPADDAREAYPGGDGDEGLGACRDEMDEINTRLKELRDVGRVWWEWGAEEGVLHDTVLTLRADAEPREMPLFRAVDELMEKLVVVGSGDDGYAYCPRMTGGVAICTSDTPYLPTPSDFANTHSAPRPHHLWHPGGNGPLPEPARCALPRGDGPPRGRRRRGAPRLFRVRRPTFWPAGRGLPAAGVCGRVPCLVVS